MDRLPFSVYDFFGYLSSGLLLLTGLTVAFIGTEPLEESPALISGLLLVVITYVVGQIVANVSGYLLESVLVGGRLGRPTGHLFAVQSPDRSALLPGYFRPLPPATQQRVLERADSAARIAEPCEALFLHCHSLVKRDPPCAERLDIFLNLYGFCRNSCMALLIGAPLLALGIVLGSADTGAVGPGWWLGGGLLAAIGLFYRYLKFYRQYAVELYSSYAELP